MSRRPWALLVTVPAIVLASGWLALVEVLWLPLRIGGVLVPVSVAVAVVGNLLLVPLAHRLTGSRVAAVLPALTWLLVVAAGSIRRPEGDLLIIGVGAAGTVNLAFLLLGALAGAFSVGRVLGTPRPRPGRPPVGGGTGTGPGAAPSGHAAGRSHRASERA